MFSEQCRNPRRKAKKAERLEHPRDDQHHRARQVRRRDKTGVASLFRLWLLTSLAASGRGSAIRYFPQEATGCLRPPQELDSFAVPRGNHYRKTGAIIDLQKILRMKSNSL